MSKRPLNHQEAFDQLHALLRGAIGLVHDSLTSTGHRYFLAYGTALGSVRHGDFIPWDVDADLYVVSDDEAGAWKAIAAATEGTPYELLLPGDAGYDYLFPRISVKGVPHTVFRVDLFPLDRAPSSRLHQKATTILFRAISQFYLARTMNVSTRFHYTTKKRLLARILRVATSPVPPVTIRALYRLVRKQIRRLSGGTHLYNPCASYGAREFYPASWFGTVGSVNLGDLSVNAPGRVEEYLRFVYGDFMKEPAADTILAARRFADEYYLAPLRDLSVI